MKFNGEQQKCTAPYKCEFVVSIPKALTSTEQKVKNGKNVGYLIRIFVGSHGRGEEGA